MCRPFRDASACLISWMDNSEKPSSSHISPSTGRDSVPALEVPLGNLQYHEDEMLSWLQYPMEDSFDKNYCAEDLHIEALASHSNFVHNTFSNLSIKEGEEFHSTGLRMQTSLPSDLKLREREGAGSSAYMASHARDVTAGYNANRGERVLAANTAMAIGAHRAAGLLFHSGAETFNKVRTHAQPHSAKRVQSALATQESGRGASNLAPHTFKAGDEKHRIQPPVQHLTNPNFPLFSRAAGSLQQDKLGIGAQGKGKDSASKGERKGRVASPMSHAHPTPMALATSSEAFSEPAISKGFSLCFPQPSATRMTGMGFSRAPLQCEARWQPSTAHLKDTAFTPYADSTKRSSISCKLRAEAVSMTPVEETTKASGSHHAKEGLPSFSATASAGLASGSVIGSSGVALLKIETKERHLTPEKGKPSSGVKSTIPTDVESSIHSELACHDSERNLNKKSELCRVKEFYSGSCPLITVSSLTTSESKVWETVERADIVMASPSGDISEKSIEEAAAFTMKRKADFAEDDEVESKHFKDEKLSQGSANVAKRTRAVEIHNLSERKRRDKINLKMKELQDLIPNANKTDKASVLDEAIEYVKLLQSQVQSMSLRTGMAGLPMLLPPGMPSSPVQQRLQPPHLNLDRGAGSGFRMDVDVFEHPCNVSGLPLASLHAGVREAHGHLQGFRESEAYELLPAQLRQQHLHSNMHTNADMFVAGTIQKEQRASQLQLPAHTTSNDDMQ